MLKNWSSLSPILSSYSLLASTIAFLLFFYYSISSFSSFFSSFFSPFSSSFSTSFSLISSNFSGEFSRGLYRLVCNIVTIGVSTIACSSSILEGTAVLYDTLPMRLCLLPSVLVVSIWKVGGYASGSGSFFGSDSVFFNDFVFTNLPILILGTFSFSASLRASISSSTLIELPLSKRISLCLAIFAFSSIICWKTLNTSLRAYPTKSSETLSSRTDFFR